MPDWSLIPTMDHVMHTGTGAMNVPGPFTQRVEADRLDCGSGAAIEALNAKWLHAWNVTFVCNGERVA